MTLGRLIADGKTPQKIVARSRIVLLSGCGLGTNAIQRQARVSKPDCLALAEILEISCVYNLMPARAPDGPLLRNLLNIPTTTPLGRQLRSWTRH
jgi:hypothetical protein